MIQIGVIGFWGLEWIITVVMVVWKWECKNLCGFCFWIFDDICNCF